jgi:hypothetical protein
MRTPAIADECVDGAATTSIDRLRPASGWLRRCPKDHSAWNFWDGGRTWLSAGPYSTIGYRAHQLAFGPRQLRYCRRQQLPTQ